MLLTLLPGWTGPPGADGRALLQLFPLPNLVLLLGEAILTWNFQGWLHQQGKEDETEEVSSMCRAPEVLSGQAACTGEGRAPGVMDHM